MDEYTIEMRRDVSRDWLCRVTAPDGRSFKMKTSMTRYGAIRRGQRMVKKLKRESEPRTKIVIL
jgi:hypothetical protein